MPTLSDSPTLSVQALLKQPDLMARQLSLLQFQALIADRIFALGSPRQVMGGSARYQQSESIFPDVAADTDIPDRSEFPRATWDTNVQTAPVKQYGLEVELSNLTIRRNQVDQVTRAMMRIANAITSGIDTTAIGLLRSTAIATGQTAAAAAAWAPSADILSDLVDARGVVLNAREGYKPDTLIISEALRDKVLKNAALRDMLPRENPNTHVQTAALPHILGFENVYVSSANTADEAFVVAAQVVGTIADEDPDAIEGWTTYNMDAPYKPVWVSVEKEGRSQIVTGARWPAMYVAEPKAVRRITGA